ncbi:MAG: PLP-dependent transferase, partial [Saccharopolyspora rectivirgula]
MSDGFATRAIHAGQDADPTTGSVVVPIHATSTYAQDGVGGLRSGYEYSRTGNPTRTALEQCLAELEGGRYARAFASGMSTTDAVLRAVLRPGDHMIIPDDAYGGTFRLIDKVLSGWGVEYTPVPLSDV